MAAKSGLDMDPKRLFKLARESISSALDNKGFKISADVREQYSDKFGVFVTLYIGKELRGCVGFSEPVLPLYKAIIEAAYAAAFSDSRFPPLKKAEFEKVRIEISILTKPELLGVDPKEYSKHIILGKHGLIIEKDQRKGLLLPQVPAEFNWDIVQFLENICLKAGLSKESYLKPNARLYTFEAKVFSE